MFSLKKIFSRKTSIKDFKKKIELIGNAKFCFYTKGL